MLLSACTRAIASEPSGDAPGIAAAPAETPPAAALAYFDETAAQLFDPQVSRDQRLQSLALVKQAAQLKNGHALHLLGSLYTMDDSHPAALVAQDMQQAKRYLSQASAAGMLLSMPLLVEIELALQNPQAAIVWAHLALHYRHQQALARPHAPAVIDAGYYSGLLARCQKALGDRYDGDQILANVNAFLTRYDTQIREHLEGDSPWPIPASLRARDYSLEVQDAPWSYRPDRGLSVPIDTKTRVEGSAAYYAGVNRNGTIKRLLLVGSLQESRYLKSITDHLRHLSYKAADESAPELRWTLITMTSSGTQRRLLSH